MIVIFHWKNKKYSTEYFGLEIKMPNGYVEVRTNSKKQASHVERATAVVVRIDVEKRADWVLRKNVELLERREGKPLSASRIRGLRKAILKSVTESHTEENSP